MKIAFCTPGSVEHEDYIKGNLLGTESQVFGLAQELIRMGHEVYILRRWYGNTKEDVSKGIRIINISSPDFADLIIQRVLTKMIFSKYISYKVKTIEPDIIVLTDIFSAVSLANVEIPKIYVTHNPPSDLVSKTPFFVKFIKKKIEKRVFDACEVIIALNTTIKTKLDELEYKNCFVPNAVEIEKYSFKQLDEKCILFGGRFATVKGLEYLISAYSQIKKDLRMQYKLILVGEGPEKANLQKMVINLGIESCVEFIPWQRDNEFIHQISKCSMFVLPSLSECMPVVILEAMALGKPVIASNIPGSKDIITHGYNGFLFEKENVNDLKNYLELCILGTDLRSEIGKNARKTIENGYTFTRIARMYLDIFYQIEGEKQE